MYHSLWYSRCKMWYRKLPITKAGKNAKFPWNMVKVCIKNVIFFTHFQIFLPEKDTNIHLNDKFPLKIAKISLQKQNFPGIRFPNSTICPCMPIAIYPICVIIIPSGITVDLSWLGVWTKPSKIMWYRTHAMYRVISYMTLGELSMHWVTWIGVGRFIELCVIGIR